MTTRIAWLACLAAGMAAAAGFDAGTSWLDAARPAAWNVAGARIPRAPPSLHDAALARQCAAQLRKPDSTSDRAIAAAGWKLLGSAQRFGDTEVVGGQSGFDGMCRPVGYQFFVFSGGRYAGTLSPVPMDSRTDGAVQVPVLVNAREIVATFARYASSDPLCCPSATTTVQFRLEKGARGPVVVPESARTVRTDELHPAATTAASPEAGMCAPAPAVTSCGPGDGAPAAAAQPVVTMRVWQLTRILMMDGTVHTPDHPAKYTLELGRDGRASVRADCNRGSASYVLEGASLAFGPIAATRALCPPGSISDRYLQQLGLVASHVEKDGKLHLATRADGAILDFQPTPGPDGLMSPTERCARGGGTVGSASCCTLVSDFPNTCLMGACGCSPENSHQVQVCRCPEGRCFNGKACVQPGPPGAGQLR